MPPRLIATAALLLALTSCTLGGSSSETSEPAGLAARIGIAEPEDVVWQRDVGGETLVGTTARANPVELALLTAAFAELPDAVLRKAEVRNLVRSPDAVRLDQATLAFSRGPDIYFIDRTFAAATRRDITHALAHELAHVAQFNELDPDLVDQVLADEIDSLDPNTSSLAVSDFAASVGWSLSVGVWRPPDGGAGTTQYGATGPSEDMAESVALVATGRANELSPTRVSWVENWLGVSAAELARGTPWRPPGASVIQSRDAIYDQATVASLGFRNVEPLYLLLNQGTATADLVEEIGRNLRERGMAGVLEAIADDRLPRFGGRFVRPGGGLLWVELWDFPASTVFANPPPGPVLTYVDVWS